jgi:gamma-glutamyltranspeptidase/glutathione hydrolase
MRVMVEEGKEPFYRGQIAERIVEAIKAAGGVMSLDDLAAHSSDWVDPIHLSYRGFRVWECPPNGQGLAALLALSLARSFDMNDFPPDSIERYHLLAECMRLAFADTSWHVADPEFAPAPVAQLLAEQYGKERSRLIDLGRANRNPKRGNPQGVTGGSDTVYFSTVDGEGNGCSFINSNFKNFGSGIVPEGCGYSLQNRGLCFSLDPEHPNRLEPKKRPYHTIIPGLLTRETDGGLHAVFGVMGGMMQAQGHLQVVSALVDDNLDPQAALDRGRFQIEDGHPAGDLLLEEVVSEEVVRGLSDRGQGVKLVGGSDRSAFGLGQIILRDSNGVLWAGSDPRGDGCAIGL